MGIVDGAKDKLGMEASGIVARTGSAVNNVKVGDRVVVVDNGCFATRKVMSGQHTVRIPPEFSFEEASTMPIIHVGQITNGQVRRRRALGYYDPKLT